MQHLNHKYFSVIIEFILAQLEMPNQRGWEEGLDVSISCCCRREPTLCNLSAWPVTPTPSRTRRCIIQDAVGSNGKLYPSDHSLAAAKYQARRHESAVGLHVVHLDEDSVNCPLRTSRGHILDTVCWTMKISSLPRSLTGCDYFPLQCGVFFFPPGMKGIHFLSELSGLQTSHKGKWSSQGTLICWARP